MNAMVYPDTPPDKITKKKNSIEEVVAEVEEMEQEAKNITKEMMQFWGSIIQDEKLRN